MFKTGNMAAGQVAIPRFIATRYVSVGKRSHLVSFMSLISIIGLAFGIAVLITVLSVMNGFDEEMRENILGIVPHVTVRSDENLSLTQWQTIIDTVNQNPAVQAMAPVVDVTGVAATQDSSRGVLINGIDADAEANVSAINRYIYQGSLEDLAATRWGVVIGQPLANQLNVTIGDKIDLFSTSINVNPITPLPTFRSFTVVGLFKVGSQNLDENLVLANLDATRALFKLRSPYNGLRIRTINVLRADEIRRELYDAVPSGVTIDSWTSQFGAIYQNIQFSRSIIGFMLWLLIGVAAFNLVVSMIMIVRDKTGDIAILRTLGASPKMIGNIFMWQGLFIGGIAIVIGVSFGLLGSIYISDIAAGIESGFGIQLLNADVYPIDFLPSRLKFADVIRVVGGVVVLSLIATLYPARRAAAIAPAAALRME